MYRIMYNIYYINIININIINKIVFKNEPDSTRQWRPFADVGQWRARDKIWEFPRSPASQNTVSRMHLELFNNLINVELRKLFDVFIFLIRGILFIANNNNKLNSLKNFSL